MKDVMIDIETLGTRPGSVILSIGAVFFDPKGGIGAEFYVNIDPEDCKRLGLTIDQKTIEWWKRQSLAAQNALTIDRQPLYDALMSFAVWFTSHNGERVWSHGANFDQPLLDAAYNVIGREVPWLFWNSRCTRTLFDLAGVDTRKMSSGVKHNALDDARGQARVVQACMQRIHVGAPAAVVVPPSPIVNAGDVFA